MAKIPQVIDKILKDDELLNLQEYFKSNYKNYYFEKKHARYLTDSNSVPILKDFLYSSLEIVRKALNNDKIVPTVGFFAHYEGDVVLQKHKDSYGGTHSLSMPLYQTEPWNLYIDDVPYLLEVNQGVAFWGQDQYHWRDPFLNPKSQHVAVIFCHYAEPGHFRLKQEDLK